MMHGIVVNIVERGPKMAVVAHVALCRAAPHLPSARLFLAVPFERKPPVHPAQVRQNVQDDAGFDERMVVIGQHAPSVNPGSTPPGRDE